MPQEKLPATLRIEGPRAQPLARSVRRFRLTTVEGGTPGQTWQSSSDRCAIGVHPLNDLVSADPTVSRFHCEVRLGPGGAAARDLGSLNGTWVDGVPVGEAFLRSGSLLRMGNAVLRFDLSLGENPLLLSEATRFGTLVGTSVPMRAAFALLERAARSDATVLLEGETGTGKGQAAHAIHLASARASQPFQVVDCASIPTSLIESELFGHERGAFTGADQRRAGAFKAAGGGTLFLDEIGELPADVQPKLLRALEEKQFRSVGSDTFKPCEARLIAATNRDLRAEVNAGRFRPDLFFRLAVVRIPLPPLSQRPDDLPILVEQLLGTLGASAAQRGLLQSTRVLDSLKGSAWPGNVRELRNHLERCMVLGTSESGESGESGAPAAAALELDKPWEQARKSALVEFERRYLEALLERHQGSVPDASRAAGINAKHLYKLLGRHGLKPRPHRPSPIE